jgi:hypothetical protein
MSRRIGLRSLGEFPFDVVRIDCERCGRARRYALAGLIERFGADAAGPDVLMELAQMRTPEELHQSMRRKVHGLGFAGPLEVARPDAPCTSQKRLCVGRNEYERRLKELFSSRRFSTNKSRVYRVNEQHDRTDNCPSGDRRHCCLRHAFVGLASR